MKLSKTAITVAVLAAIITTPAMAGPKPIVGKYTCKGTATATVDPNIIGIKPGSKTQSVKAKMSVTKGSGAFDLDILTYGWQNSMVGGFPTEYQQNPAIRMGNNARYKGLSRGCLISIMWQSGSATQNRNGRRVTTRIQQSYYCTGSTIYYTDAYNLTCSR